MLAIQGVESNHGTMLNHEQITNPKSIHYGDRALSSFGIMPNTIKMHKKDPERFKTDLKYQRKVAKIHTIKVLQKTRGCPLTASILWLKGRNYKVKPADYQTPRYKRFVAEWERFRGLPLHKDPLILKWCANNNLIKFN